MIYVTSDLHGYDPEAFGKLLRQAGFTGEDFLFVLGDVIDRGEHGVALLRWMAAQPNVQPVLGNHEAMLLSCRFLFDEVNEDSLAELDLHRLSLLQTWLENGAAPTLRELRTLLKTQPDVLEGLLEYLQEAPLYETVEAGGRQYILVHAGLDNFAPEKPMDDYTPEELLWARPTLQTRYFDNATVIFGHTPTVYLTHGRCRSAVKTDSWICIDTGAAMGNAPMLLRLDDLQEFYGP